MMLPRRLITHAKVLIRKPCGFFIWMSGSMAPVQAPVQITMMRTGSEGTSALQTISVQRMVSATWCRVIMAGCS